MAVEVIAQHQTPSSSTERWAVKGPSGEIMTAGSFTTIKMRFADEWVTGNRVGGVGTDPEYRRGGHVREILEESFRQAKERGWAFSLLHPFSFGYYRKFGYERVADHLIVDMPMNKLEFVPRCADFVRVRTEELLQDVLKVYDAFSKGRNFMAQRLDGTYYPLDKYFGEHATYLHYNEAGEPDAAVTVGMSKTLMVNHYTDTVLIVKEMIYTSKAALTATLGFLRMFEGETDTIHFDNLAMSPEVDWAIKHYTHTSYKILPDMAVRVLDTEALLRANSWPKREGVFTMRVTDDYGYADGAWKVAYADGKAQIEKLDEAAQCDITMDVRPLAQLMFGYVDVSEDSIGYLDGVTVSGDVSDFLRAFPKRPCGMFEHF